MGTGDTKKRPKRNPRPKRIGQYDNAKQLASPDPLVRERAQMEAAASALILAAMSPPGSLGLPPLLEKKRLEFGITDGAFDVQCLFERVYIHQVDVIKGNVTAGGITLPDTVKDRSTREASRGIIVSAGLRALDILRSNGVDLGHTIQMIRNAPWRIQVDNVGGRDKHLIVLNAGDCLGSYELAEAKRKGRMIETVAVNKDGALDHAYRRKGDKQTLGAPQTPWISEDF